MVEVKNAKALAFNSDEYVSFETVMNTMTQLQEMFPRETVRFLQNPVTGEIVDPDDFARVKGVIDFLRNCPFEIIPMQALGLYFGKVLLGPGAKNFLKKTIDNLLIMCYTLGTVKREREVNKMTFIRKNFNTLTEEEKKVAIRKEMEYRTGSNTSAYHYHIATELFNTYSFLRDEWYHFPEKHFIKDRFIKKSVLAEQGEESFPIPPAIAPTKKTCGLYLIGTTTFNPYTNQPFFWIKIGKSEDLEKRMRSYGSHSPTIWRIDFQKIPKRNVSQAERLYHTMLSTIGVNNAEYSKEWYEVSKENYLAICNEKFNFFNHYFNNYQIMIDRLKQVCYTIITKRKGE